MSLASRLRQIELKIRPMNTVQEHLLDIDQCISHMGFDPAALRESAHNTGKSVVETMCEIIGIEPREFLRILREKANLVR